MRDETLSRRTMLGFIAGATSSVGGIGAGAVFFRHRTRQESSTDDTAGQVSGPRYENNGVLGVISDQRLSTDPRAISIRGSYALVSGVGLSIVDIAEPREMVEVASLSASDARGFGHVRIDDYAYMTNISDSKITVVDVGDPRFPTVVSEFQHPQMGSPRKLAARDDFLFVSSHDFTDNFSVLDITNRKRPEMVGHLSHPNLRGRCQEIGLVGQHAIVADKDSNVVQSIDIAEPTSPARADSVALGQPFGLYRWGNKMIVSLTNRTNGLAVLDVTDPSSIELVTKQTDNTLNSVYGTAYDDGYLYCSDKYGYYGYHAIRLNSGQEPRVTDSVSSPSLEEPYDVALGRGVAFVVSRGNQRVVSLSTHGDES